MKKATIIITCLLLTTMLFGCVDKNVSGQSTVQMRVQDGYIQYYTGETWDNLISTEELKGEKGDKGDKGDPGIPGKNGVDGKDGVNGINGTNGLNGKDGVDGKNGKDGKDGIDGKDAGDGITKTFNVSTMYQGYLPEDFDYDKWVGFIEVKSLDKAVISQQNELNKKQYRDVELLMNENGEVQLTAKPVGSWKFYEWSDGVKEATRTINYNDEHFLTAYFKYTKTPLAAPEVTECYSEPDTFNIKLAWKADENAKDYTIIIKESYDGSPVKFTTKTNSMAISPEKLNNKSYYYITVIANPKDVDNYCFTSYKNNSFYYEQRVTVENFVGKTIEEFMKWCEINEINYIDMYINDSAKKGTILSQSHLSGTISKYDLIQVHVSEGPMDIYPEPSTSPEPAPEPSPEPSPEPAPSASPEPSPEA